MQVTHYQTNNTSHLASALSTDDGTQRPGLCATNQVQLTQTTGNHAEQLHEGGY